MPRCTAAPIANTIASMTDTQDSKDGILSDDAVATIDESQLTLGMLGVTSVEMLKSMLRRENELRLSSAVQEQYRAGGYGAYVGVTESVQRQVSEEFGLTELKGAKALQCADFLVSTAADRAEIHDISLYRKFNRIRDGALTAGQAAPDIKQPLYELDGSSVTFRELVQLFSSATFEMSTTTAAATAVTSATAATGVLTMNDQPNKPVLILASSHS